MTAKTIPAWCADISGKPFELGANGPDAFDCWGVVRWGMWHGYGVGLPSLDGLRDAETGDQLEAGIEACDGAWCAVDAADVREGDVLQFKGRGLGMHVGLVVSDGWMIHSMRGRGGAMDRYRRHPWTGLLVAAYRHREVTL